jgi:hypothetical protein
VDVLGDRTDPKIEANGYVAPIRDGMRLLQRVATSLRQARNFFFKRFSGLYGGTPSSRGTFSFFAITTIIFFHELPQHDPEVFPEYIYLENATKLPPI